MRGKGKSAETKKQEKAKRAHFVEGWGGGEKCVEKQSREKVNFRCSNQLIGQNSVEKREKSRLAGEGDKGAKRGKKREREKSNRGGG